MRRNKNGRTGLYTKMSRTYNKKFNLKLRNLETNRDNLFDYMCPGELGIAMVWPCEDGPKQY